MSIRSSTPTHLSEIRRPRSIKKKAPTDKSHAMVLPPGRTVTSSTQGRRGRLPSNTEGRAYLSPGAPASSVARQIPFPYTGGV